MLNAERAAAEAVTNRLLAECGVSLELSNAYLGCTAQVGVSEIAPFARMMLSQFQIAAWVDGTIRAVEIDPSVITENARCSLAAVAAAQRATANLIDALLKAGAN